MKTKNEFRKWMEVCVHSYRVFLIQRSGIGCLRHLKIVYQRFRSGFYKETAAYPNRTGSVACSS
uniref:Uncharacterized protein n=1 Tax=Erpetoichthys calabaricus TaxID=27687 RepID=A0A8C4T5D8_ERPCA